MAGIVTFAARRRHAREAPRSDNSPNTPLSPAVRAPASADFPKTHEYFCATPVRNVDPLFREMAGPRVSFLFLNHLRKDAEIAADSDSSGTGPQSVQRKGEPRPAPLHHYQTCGRHVARVGVTRYANRRRHASNPSPPSAARMNVEGSGMVVVEPENVPVVEPELDKNLTSIFVAFNEIASVTAVPLPVSVKLVRNTSCSVYSRYGCWLFWFLPIVLVTSRSTVRRSSLLEIALANPGDELSAGLVRERSISEATP